MSNLNLKVEDRPRFRPTLWKWAFIFLFLLNVAVIGRDVYPRLYTKFVHMKKGCACSDKEYSRLVAAVAINWMDKPPVTAITDDRRFLILDDIHRWYNDPLHVSWPQAILAKGICDLHYVNKDPKLLITISRFIGKMVNSDGNLVYPLNGVEQVSFGSTLLYMYEQTRDEKYLKAAKHMINYLKQQAASNGGTVPYVQGSSLRLVDTLPMICPFLAEYGISQNDPLALQLAIRQLVEYSKYGVDRRTGTPIHAYNAKFHNMPAGGVGWGRGAGWYARGIVYTVKLLSTDIPEKKYLEDCIRSFAKLVVECELTDGGWGSKLGIPEGFDSSSTALIADALEVAINTGIIESPSYNSTVKKALLALKKHTRTDGTVDFAEGNCMDVGRYSSLSIPTPYAQGAVLSFISHIKESQHKTENSHSGISCVNKENIR